MATRYQQLNLEDRCTIARLHAEGCSRGPLRLDVAKGVVLTPPPKVYVEPARLSSAQTRVNALG